MDEAGYTGPDLVNQDQPVLVLGSTILGDAEARDLVAACFPTQEPGRELKHSRLSRTNKWRAEVIEFVRQVPKDKIAFFGVHKEFALLAYLIEFWLEPLAYRDGVNLYERGANIALSNVSFITLGATLSAEGRRELLRRFQVMTRDRTEFAYESFWESLREAMRRHDLIEKALGPLLVAEHELGWAHLHVLPRDLLDLGEYGVLDTIVHWRRKQPDGQFDVIHDHSKMMERNRQRWEAILDPSNPAAIVGQDRRTIEFPLPVQGLRLEDSTQCLQLQIADIVAGAACAFMTAKVRNARPDYTEALLEGGILDAVAGGVWPSDSISPEQLETDGPVLRDSADFMGEIIKRHKERQS